MVFLSAAQSNQLQEGLYNFSGNCCIKNSAVTLTNAQNDTKSANFGINFAMD